jgi:hypothetical protein
VSQGGAIRFAVLAAAALCVSTAAMAQRTGSRIGQDASARNLRMVMTAMSECFASRQPVLVRRWFHMLPGSGDEFRLLSLNEPEISTCTDNDKLVMDGMVIKFSPAAMRGPVALVSARRLLAHAPSASPASADSEPWFLPELKKVTSPIAVDAKSITLMDFGHCIAVHQWQGTVGLLAAPAGSQEERVAVRQLRPVLGPCLPAQAKIEMTAANLREIVAEPVYHILNGEVAPAEVAG